MLRLYYYSGPHTVVDKAPCMTGHVCPLDDAEVALSPYASFFEDVTDELSRISAEQNAVSVTTETVPVAPLSTTVPETSAEHEVN